MYILSEFLQLLQMFPSGYMFCKLVGHTNYSVHLLASLACYCPDLALHMLVFIYESDITCFIIPPFPTFDPICNCLLIIYHYTRLLCYMHILRLASSSRLFRLHTL